MHHEFSSLRRIGNCRLAVHSLFVVAVLSVALVVPSAFAQVQHVVNPFADATVYLNPDYTTEVNSAIATEPPGSTLANQMAVVATYPTAVWMDRMAAITGGSGNNGRLGLAQHITTALSQQKGTQPVLVEIVIYDLPDRDCAALASNGEISIAANPPTQPLTGIQTYEQDYITPIYNILSPYATNPNIRFVLVVEDDSLPNMITNTGLSYSLPNCIAANDGESYPTLSMNGVYVLGIQYALNTFHTLPNVYQYLDVGHHGWLGWTANMAAAVPFFLAVAQGTTAGVSSIDGFITNTANYGPTKEPYMTATEEIGGSPIDSSTFYQFNPEIDEEDYAATFDASLISAGFPSTLGFLIDTSRNGWGGTDRPTGPSTSTVVNTFVDASKIDQRDDMGQWCNQENQGLGAPPTVNPGYFANLYAYVWIKPPGESDGNYPGSVYNGVTSTTGDPNCDPSHDNALANGMLTEAIPNSPPAGTFWVTEFAMDVQNAFPAVPTSTAPGFSISASGATVMQGTTGTSSVTVSPFNGFTGTVALTASGLPGGVTAAFNPTSVTGSTGSTLTFTASATATVGTATVTVTGTSGSTTESATLSLIVTAEPNFTISVSPSAISLPPGSNPTSTITVTYVGGLTGSVSLNASNLPSGVSANFAPSSLNASGTSVVNFSAQTSTPPGTTNISINGVDGSITHSATITLTVPGSSSCTTVPSSPTGLTATAASSSGINLSWTAVTPPANCTITSYTVYRSTTSGFTPSSSNQVGTVTSGTTFSDTGLTASTTYYYKIEAVDADGSSAASAQASATTSAGASCTAVPSAPVGLTAMAASSSAINLSWTAVTPPANCTISSYTVYRSTTSGFTPSSSNQVGSVTSGTTFSNTGLTASTTYYYKIEAVDADGSSAASAQASATTSASGGGFACHIAYSITTQWPGGFGAAITINNTGTIAISSWTLTWTFANGQTITQLWNGTETQSGANVTVNNLSYNGTIAAGGNYSGMGFNGSWNNTTNAVPASFAVNGTTCN